MKAGKNKTGKTKHKTKMVKKKNTKKWLKTYTNKFKNRFQEKIPKREIMTCVVISYFFKKVLKNHDYYFDKKSLDILESLHLYIHHLLSQNNK